MPEHTPDEVKALVSCLLSQYPNPYVRFSWYPADLPNGRKVEIRKTIAVRSGVPFLHIRQRVKLVIYNEGSDEALDAGSDWAQWRVNLVTCAMERIA